MNIFSKTNIMLGLLVYISVSINAMPFRKGYNILDKNIVKKGYDFYNDTNAVDKILYRLSKLPEVRWSNLYIDSFTRHTHRISMRVVEKPDSMKKYYWIAVGYNNDERFETYYNFYVWPDKMIIKYLDSKSGKVLTLSEWRKTRTLEDVIR
jgi:hypothetical protein